MLLARRRDVKVNLSELVVFRVSSYLDRTRRCPSVSWFHVPGIEELPPGLGYFRGSQRPSRTEPQVLTRRRELSISSSQIGQGKGGVSPWERRTSGVKTFKERHLVQSVSPSLPLFLLSREVRVSSRGLVGPWKGWIVSFEAKSQTPCSQHRGLSQCSALQEDLDAQLTDKRGRQFRRRKNSSRFGWHHCGTSLRMPRQPYWRPEARRALRKEVKSDGPSEKARAKREATQTDADFHAVSGHPRRTSRRTLRFDLSVKQISASPLLRAEAFSPDQSEKTRPLAFDGTLLREHDAKNKTFENGGLPKASKHLRSPSVLSANVVAPRRESSPCLRPSSSEATWTETLEEASSGDVPLLRSIVIRQNAMSRAAPLSHSANAPEVANLQKPPSISAESRSEGASLKAPKAKVLRDSMELTMRNVLKSFVGEDGLFRVACLLGEHRVRLQEATAPHLWQVRNWLHLNGALLVSAGSLLSLTGTLMTDMSLLRAFNISSSLCFFAFNMTRSPRMWAAAAWNVVFLILNAGMLWRLYTEHRELTFSSDELDIFEKYFLPAGLSPRQYRRLLRLASWRVLPRGRIIQQEGTESAELHFLVRGSVQVASKEGTLLHTHRGGEKDAVIGLEPFLERVAALKRRQSKAKPSLQTKTPTVSFFNEGVSEHWGDNQPSVSQDKTELARNASSSSETQEEQGRSSPGGSLQGVSFVSSASAKSEEDPQQQQQQQQQQSQQQQQQQQQQTAGSQEAAQLASDSGSPCEGLLQTGPHLETLSPREKETSERVCSECLSAASSLDSPESVPSSQAPVERPPNNKAANVYQEEPAFPRSETVSCLTDASNPAADLEETRNLVSAEGWRGVKVKGEGDEADEDTKSSTSALEFDVQEAPLLNLLSEAPSIAEEASSGSFAALAEATAVCSTEATLLCIDAKALAFFVVNEPAPVGLAVLQGLTTVLVERSKLQASRAALQNYDAVLAGVLADGVVKEGERQLLKTFRKARDISLAQHEEALSRLGWSPEDFERGVKVPSQGLLSGIVSGGLYFLTSFWRPRAEAPPTHTCAEKEHLEDSKDVRRCRHSAVLRKTEESFQSKEEAGEGEGNDLDPEDSWGGSSPVSSVFFANFPALRKGARSLGLLPADKSCEEGTSKRSKTNELDEALSYALEGI